MPKPITHGELAEWIYGVQLDGKNLPRPFIADMIAKTRNGVIPEVGYLDGRELMAPQLMDTDSVLNRGGVSNGFAFGPASEKEMIGVDKRLVAVARLALTKSTQDFTFFDGVRTIKEQEALLRKGATKTMQSKHIDGLAMDLVPYHNGKPTWDWKLIYPIILAVDEAATQLGFAHLITWGGAWDRKLSDFGSNAATSYRDAVEEYTKRHPGKDFIDGPHFQIEKP